MSIKSKVVRRSSDADPGRRCRRRARHRDRSRAATPSCGDACVNIFSKLFGTHRHPNFVMDVWRQAAKVGQPIILFRASNSDPAEDFTVSFQGLVSDFFAAGLVVRGNGPPLRWRQRRSGGTKDR